MPFKLCRKSQKTKKRPSRWNKFSNLGNVIQGTRFIPFKTPLSNKWFNGTDYPQDQFTPTKLIDVVPDLKFVIDLSATDKWYNGNIEFLDKGIGYEKLVCVGGGTLPSERTVRLFHSIVDEFRRFDDGKGLIGVHCTHGLNRTGYMICRYMVDQMGISPAIAIKRFEEARGHHIERETYRKYLLGISL